MIWKEWCHHYTVNFMQKSARCDLCTTYAESILVQCAGPWEGLKIQRRVAVKWASGWSAKILASNLPHCPRYHQRFFVWVGLEIAYAHSGNKYFFTKWCHLQTAKLQTTSLKISKFWFSKSFFSLKNQCNLSEYFFWRIFD